MSPLICRRYVPYPAVPPIWHHPCSLAGILFLRPWTAVLVGLGVLSLSACRAPGMAAAPGPERTVRHWLTTADQSVRFVPPAEQTATTEKGAT